MAWNGLFVWWIPVVDYTIWSVVMCWATARAINQQHAEEGDSAAIDMTYAMRPASDQRSGQPHHAPLAGAPQT